MTGTQLYIGTKQIIAAPMTRQAYNDYRDWTLPADENGEDEGFLVEYTDGGASNHPNHFGYISWSPRDVFEKAYQPVTQMSFGHAVEMLKAGYKVARAGWNGKGMFLFLVQGSRFKVNRAPLLGIYPEGTEIDYHAHIDMKTAQGYVVPWLASQADVLADDWTIVNSAEPELAQTGDASSTLAPTDNAQAAPAPADNPEGAPAAIAATDHAA